MDLLTMTTDINGKPIPVWQERLEQMYTEGVPFGEILSLVRYLTDEKAIERILSMTDEEALATIPGDPAQFAMDMRKRFDAVARLVKERDLLRRELETAIAWIDQAHGYVILDPSAPNKYELLEQLRAALVASRRPGGREGRTMIVDYAKTETPPDYVCSTCGATGCKLWRRYQTMAPDLLCGGCALSEEGEAGPIDAQGYRESEHGRTDQIGWYVPAVPDEEGIGYWGYTSVPEAGVRWWRALPT